MCIMRRRVIVFSRSLFLARALAKTAVPLLEISLALRSSHFSQKCEKNTDPQRNPFITTKRRLMDKHDCVAAIRPKFLWNRIIRDKRSFVYTL